MGQAVGGDPKTRLLARDMPGLGEAVSRRLVDWSTRCVGSQSRAGHLPTLGLRLALRLTAAAAGGSRMAVTRVQLRSVGKDNIRAQLRLLADEVNFLLLAEPAADAASLLTSLRRCFADFTTRDRELDEIAEQIRVWYLKASPARAQALTRCLLAQHASLLLRRRAGASRLRSRASVSGRANRPD